MKTAIILIIGGLVTLGIAIANSNLDTSDQSIQAVVKHEPIKQEPAVKLAKSKMYELNLNDRVVYIYGEIGDNASDIAKRILYLGETSESITILINSPGGSVVDGAEIISAIEASKAKVNTVCVELCASMAAIIHSYGTRRYMINRSVLMFHPATAGAQGEVSKMASRIGFLKLYTDKMNANIAKRSGRSVEDFDKLWQVEHWVDAEDATEQGFNDAIVFVRGANALRLYPELSPSLMKANKTDLNNFQWR